MPQRHSSGCHRIPLDRARLPTVLESLDQFSRRMLAMTHICTSTRIKEDPSPACRAIGWRLGRRRMTRSQIAEPQYTLAGISIFSALPPNALETVHRRCSWRRYEQGEPIVDYLDASDDVFFVAAGEVCVTIYSLAGKAVSFRNLGPGDIFGEYAAIDGEPRSASVEARTSCLIASMTGEGISQALEERAGCGAGGASGGSCGTFEP